MSNKKIQTEIIENESALLLPALALRGLVIFPKMIMHFEVAREKSIAALNQAMNADQKIFLAAQRDLRIEEPQPSDIYKVGVVATVRQILKSPHNTLRVLVEGEYRARATSFIDDEEYLKAELVAYPMPKRRIEKSILEDALMRKLKELFDEYSYYVPKMPKEIVVNVMGADDPVALAEYLAGNVVLNVEHKQHVLELSSTARRLEYLISVLENENNILMLEQEISEKVKGKIEKNQREYYLREQLKVISEELGESENPQDEAEGYIQKIKQLSLNTEVEEKFISEASRLSKMPYNSHEAAVIRGYLDLCLSLPWNERTKDKIDLEKAEKLLDKEHYGMKKVKERILELLAVRKLAPEIKGQIICLVGPPGVGKTSIARSFAKAMGRNFVRISLGGVRDESDIRGHRKTYIGAMPGRIINAFKQAGSKNPFILLDEIDKMGNDFRGDPASAMLEVLDSEQNVSFRDHFIEVPFDISEAVFLTTANTLDTVPAPLRDRMEIIQLSSYTREEKFHIAKEYLIPKQQKRHGLSGRTLRINDRVIYDLIDYYTREAGVRNIEREISGLCRKSAKMLVSGQQSRVVITSKDLQELIGPKKYKDETLHEYNQVGVVNGLAFTTVGGELLQIEVAVLEGTGKIEITGSLGDVMIESAKTAVSFIRSIAQEYDIPHDFYKTRDIHIHAPEGAVPKDGPSAGITIATALLSALTDSPVRHDVAMTGEISLRGRVLPIGGLKEKTMAAYRTGMKKVIIPMDNVPDLSEIDDVVKNALEFVPVKHYSEVISQAIILKSKLSMRSKEEAVIIPAKPESDNRIIPQ